MVEGNKKLFMTRVSEGKAEKELIVNPALLGADK
jgi:hypothetical protein